MRAAALVAIAACGGGAAPPAQIAAGPATIDSATVTLDFGGLSLDHFVAIGKADDLDPTHYYDPTDPTEATLVPAARATGRDGDWLVLDDGVKLRLIDGPFDGCAELDVDASKVKDAAWLQLALPRAAGEPIYGTGDAAATANVAGSVRELQLRVDQTSESSTNETHVPVPLVMFPRRGAALFVADDRPGALDLAKTDPGVVSATFTLPSRGMYQVFLYTAPTDDPLALVRDYVALTAKPRVPPKWAFAPMLWRNVWDSSDEMLGDADALRSRHIPTSTMWIDDPWQTGFNTFAIDQTRFASPDQLLAGLAQRGFNVVFWSSPYVDVTGVTAADYATAAANGYFVDDGSGQPLDFPWSNGPGGLVDFTNPAAAQWWGARVQAFVQQTGAKGFKLDFGEDVVPELGGTLIDMELAGGDNSVLHARYSAGYHQTYLAAQPVADAFAITRAGAWGEQASNTAIWPGDLDSDLSPHGIDNGSGELAVGGLPSAISRGLSLSVSGYPFYGSDIGGFRSGPNSGAPTTETLLRWAEYAALGTIMQLGGGGPDHDPWDTTLYDAGADATYATYAELHMQLVPYLWMLALQAGTDGTPVTRPAGFVYDCACDDAMFLLGDALLVAPVIEPGATTRDVVLPPGTWVDRATGIPVSGDGQTSITVPAPLDAIPLWYRAGSIVPMFALPADTLLGASTPGVTSYTDPALGGELRLIVTPGAAATLAMNDGTTASASADATTLGFSVGSDYGAITFDLDARALPPPVSAPSAVLVDGVPLPSVGDAATLQTCVSGCWWFDLPNKHLQIRVALTGSHQISID
ncbi:MAG TPA: TIM-barrel domain-containing protein [Kofleriaceae bacterium]|nr:TIM-barrel domain-containing protein [Kofleriaceae bacterium]